MAMVTYPWNPFQERIDCIVENEDIKPSGNDLRREFVPRYAPFFAKDFQLFKSGSTDPLKPGIDYAFAHPFAEFAKEYNRNVYGSVVLLKPVGTAVLTATYSTIGTPFVLNEIAYAELVANIANSPRQAYWKDLVGVPVEFPADPHEHPATLTYDYLTMMERLENLILVMAGTEGGNGEMTTKQLLEEHLAKGLPEAHKADAAAVGLDLAVNAPKATLEDLAGNSDNAMVSIKVLKEAFRLASQGKLDLN